MSGDSDLYGNLFGFDTGVDDTAIQESVSDLTVLQGDGNSPPVTTESGGQIDTSVLQKLGSIGTVARDVGTAVGTLQRDLKGAGRNYDQARRAAASGNGLQTWWLYASTTDKLMVGLAVLGIIVVIATAKD